MGTQEKLGLMNQVFKLFKQQSETEKAFILGYMIATSQEKALEQTTTA